MLHLTPRPFHRLVLRIGHAARKWWWRIARARVEGCAILAVNEHAHVLLVRHSYGRGHWTFPSGGLKRGEDPLAAALRELREEALCELAEPRLLLSLDERLHGAPHLLHVVTGRIAGVPRADGRELAQLAFFPRNALPPRLDRRVPALLALLD